VALYEFTCPDCGPFEVRRPMGESAVPAACPSCAGEARRVFTPPGIYRTPLHVRRARGMEEKSAHEPAVVGERRGRPMPHRHHGPGSPPWVLGH